MGLDLSHVLGWRRLRCGSWLLLGSVLRSALCLQLLGVKHAVAAEAAIGQGLRIVFKSIGRSFGPGVIHCQILILLYQHKLHVGPGPLDRSRLHIAGDSQTLRVRAVAHLMQLLDGDVVALAVLDTGVCQVGKQQQDEKRRSAKLQIRLQWTGHRILRGRTPPLTLSSPRIEIKIGKGALATDLTPLKATLVSKQSKLCRAESANAL